MRRKCIGAKYGTEDEGVPMPTLLPMLNMFQTEIAISVGTVLKIGINIGTGTR